ncbi:MAG: dienelactone hydrolase family protein [Gomphosphaeria aponina SAG 52.96 = DSM 107014]|uniref:Dienelactone hydrolase family protein n=1 Tax=Gomphosphaeria aponina SAG 52.96 = DSM 107014 TaxID=1521640 RepID=A0A941GQQ9_9CHRO|nr:dienelactone hydrolase family protein [Gomphosphaeria aponina SAG 52.96 = DSM 107014]
MQVKIKNGDLDIDAYLATPATAEPVPAVVVIQEIFGVNEHIRDVTERLAQAGYVAIAPAIYQRQAPGFAAGYTQADIAIGKKYKGQTKAAELLSDIQVTIDYLYGLPQVKKNGVGCIGFCFGGHVAYLAATLESIKATASFYGAQITTWTPGEGEPTVKRTSAIKGTLYAFFGLEDASIPVEQVDEIETELKKAGVKHKVFRYRDADHGFFCDQRAGYNKKAAEDAWLHVLELFRNTL